MIETVMSAEGGHLYLSGVLVEHRDRDGVMVATPVDMRFEREVEEIRSVMDDVYDRIPTWVPTAQSLKFTAKDIYIRTQWNVGDAPEWIPYVYVVEAQEIPGYESGEVAWIEGQLQLISSDELYGSEWRAKFTDTVTVRTRRDGTFPTSPTMMEG